MSGGRKVDWEAVEKGERGRAAPTASTASEVPPPASPTRAGGGDSLRDWFERFTGHRPHRWQERLALDVPFGDRLIRVPTGLGKTAGVVASWAWNRLERGNEPWPRRLVWCLPMSRALNRGYAAGRALAAFALLPPSSKRAGPTFHLLMETLP
jgi:hypothetical protein